MRDKQTAYHEAGHLTIIYRLGRKTVAIGGSILHDIPFEGTEGETIALLRGRHELPEVVKTMYDLAGMLSEQMMRNPQEPLKTWPDQSIMVHAAGDLNKIEERRGVAIWQSEEFANTRRITEECLRKNWLLVDAIAQELIMHGSIENDRLRRLAKISGALLAHEQNQTRRGNAEGRNE